MPRPIESRVRQRVLRPVLAIAVALTCMLAATGFNTPAPAPPFFFIQLSDPQLGMFTADTNFTQETVNFERAVAGVNRLHPAFVLVTGDLVNKTGDAAQIAEYKRIVSTIDRGIPVYNMAGNHDVENAPTPASVAAYVARFGPDHYVFRSGDLVGIVLNSSVIAAPAAVPVQFAEQDRWLRAQLDSARLTGAHHLLIVQHHPWFLKSATEADQYFNIPNARRAPYLALFHEAGVQMLVSGHYHRNAVARDGSIEMVTTGPVGKPLGPDKSGLRVFIVTDSAITHRYYALDEVPDRIFMSREHTPSPPNRRASLKVTPPAPA